MRRSRTFRRTGTGLAVAAALAMMGMPVAQGAEEAAKEGGNWAGTDDFSVQLSGYARAWASFNLEDQPELSAVGKDIAGSFEGAVVNRKMRELPITTKLIKNARIRPEDGRVIMDLYLVEVKKPAESKYPGDFYRILSTVPGEKVFVSLADSECPLIKK